MKEKISNQIAHDRAVGKFGPGAKLVYESWQGSKSHKIYRKPNGFMEWLDSYPDGVLIGVGPDWEYALKNAETHGGNPI